MSPMLTADQQYYLGLTVVVVLILAVLFFGSRTSGWHKLAKYYPSLSQYEGQWISQLDFFGKDADGVNVDFNHNESDGAIKLGADGQGLHMVMSAVFKPFHSPLFIPWNDVHGVWVQGAPWIKEKNLLRITFAQCPDIPLDVDRHIAGEMQKMAAGRWTIPKVE